MKYVIDEKVCKKHNLTLSEVLALSLIRSTKNVDKLIESLVKCEKLVKGDMFSENEYLITQRWSDELDAVLLESDTTIPSSDRIESLVSKMRELFPKGMKVGNSAWRGNVRELKLRMQKFFKMYGNYDDEAILEATKRYVESFNGDYTYMRILKYFILKSELKQHEGENGETVQQVEDVSMLANVLDNPEEQIIKRTRLI